VGTTYAPVNIIVLCGACIELSITNQTTIFDEAAEHVREKNSMHSLLKCLGAQHILWYLIHWYFHEGEILLFYETPCEGYKAAKCIYTTKNMHIIAFFQRKTRGCGF